MQHFSDLEAILRQQAMPADGIAMVKKAFMEAPVRKELGHGGNVRTDFLSKKTGRIIRTESHTNELLMAQELERDPTVLWYALQPFILGIFVGTGIGSTRVLITPDAIIVRADRTDVEEWKLPSEYARLPEKHPRRYRLDAQGVVSPPAVLKVSPWGMGFQVRHPGHLTGAFLENCGLLADFIGSGMPPLGAAAVEAIRLAFETSHVWTIKTLRESFPVLSADDVFCAVGAGSIFADLKRDRLATPELAYLYSSELRARIAQSERDSRMQSLIGPAFFDIAIGMVFELDGNQYTVELIGDREVVVRDAAGKQRRLGKKLLDDAYPEVLKIVSLPAGDRPKSELAYLLEFASEDDLRDADRKIRIVRGEEPDVGVPLRTLTSWRSRVAKAEAQGFEGILGLIPRRNTQGNRIARIDEGNIKLVGEILDLRFYTPERPSKRSAYKFYETACIERSFVPVSEQTFGVYADRLEDKDRQFRRYGKRMARAKQPAHMHEIFMPSVHGSRALDVLSIDHTLADVELCSERDAVSLGRPWLSTAVCTHSRRILAQHLSFLAPNASVVLNLLRELVRRVERLPRVLLLDNGADFRCAELETFCRAYDVQIRWRPPGMARVGAVMERTFGVINTELLHRLRGSTKIMTAVRTVTGSVLPAEVTLWTLRHLKTALQFYADEIYNEEQHPIEGPLSRNDVYRQSFEKHGHREHKRVIVDETLKILTSPFVDRRTRNIDIRTGIKVNETYYHSAELRVPGFHGCKTDVRRDPENVDVVYVKNPVSHRWIIAQRVNRLEARGLNSWEMQLYSAELVQRKCLSVEHAKNPDRVNREARLCGLIDTFEKEGHKLFKQLREEGRVNTQRALDPAKVSEPVSPLTKTAKGVECGDAQSKDKAPPTGNGFEDYSGGLQ